jgi:transposase-like protein
VSEKNEKEGRTGGGEGGASLWLGIGIEVPDEIVVGLGEVREAAKEGLLAMSVAVGLRVMGEMMEEEVTMKVGPKHAKLADRLATRHASAPGSVVLGGRRIKVRRPRARTTDGNEVHLDTYGAFSDDHQLTEVVTERMLAGLATRRHQVANEPVGRSVEVASRATSGSAVSRRFVARTRGALRELMARDISDLALVALMIDGVKLADRCCVVALGVRRDGTKVPLGLFLGDTENKKVVTALLADLVSRGLSADSGLLVVIDGAKALDRGVRDVFGPLALVQRCGVHKRKGIASHLPKDEQRWVDRRLAKAFNHADPSTGLRLAEDLARQLEDRWPDAAASVREGLWEIFTIRRLKVSDRLARSLGCTNAIESMISVLRSTTRNVKRWRDAEMIERWAAAGLLNAERSFRRVQGCNDMATLVAGLACHAASVRLQHDIAEVA